MKNNQNFNNLTRKQTGLQDGFEQTQFYISLFVFIR